MFSYTSSQVGEPHTTNSGLSVSLATWTMSLVKGTDIEASAPVIGITSMSTLGSATMARRIFMPRSSELGAPPESTGLLTLRYPGMNSRSTSWVSGVRSGRDIPAPAIRSAICAPVPPEIA